MPTSGKSSRREFLRGRAAIDALHGVAAGAIPPLETQQENYLTRFSRRAMACEFEVLLNAGQYSHAGEAALAVLDLVDQLESQLTVYRDDSEISRLNHSADQRDVEVEPRLFSLLEQAAEISRETNGGYDITSGPLSKAWGFYRRDGRVPGPSELSDVMQRVGMHNIELIPDKNAIRFLRPGVEINLGSIGKGYALDRMRELLIAEGIESFLLHGGNSSVLARGRSHESGVRSQEPVDDDRCSGWWIGLRHPLLPERRIGEILLHNRALGTSGSGTQFFIHDGRRYGHILDPRNGWPAEGTLSTTVAADSAAEADALATAFYVMGRDKAIDYCQGHRGIAAAIISPAGDGRIELTLCGFAADQVRIHVDDSIVVRPILIEPDAK
jgi:thiamine biosynthesis lipoprotein